MGYDDYDYYFKVGFYIVGELKDVFGCLFQNKDFDDVVFEKFIYDLEWVLEYQVYKVVIIFIFLYYY